MFMSEFVLPIQSNNLNTNEQWITAEVHRPTVVFWGPRKYFVYCVIIYDENNYIISHNTFSPSRQNLLGSECSD